MKSGHVLIASAVAIAMLAAGCSSGESGGAQQVKPEKTNIVVNAFPAIDSAGLYIAQDEGLSAAQGLHVTIVPVKNPPPSTQDLVNDIGTLLIDSLLVAHGLTPRQVHYASVPFPAVASTLTIPHSARSGLLPKSTKCQVTSMIAG